ncbi:MAG: M56 family metallopeptidase [Ruminococcus sp.]|nr:M56 family metallopeptidase [Ruminococcus sp.]
MKETIITASVLILFIVLLRKICKGRISAGVQYMLWLLVAARLIMPGIAALFPEVLPESDFSIMNAIDKVETAVQEYIYAGEAPEQISEPVSGFPYLLSSEDGPTAVFLAGRVTWAWMDILHMIWYIGITAAGLWMIAVNVRFAGGLRKNRRKFDAKDFKLPVYLVKDISSPCLYGLPGRQAVYIPEDIADDDEKIRHILTHEYCHYKHKDVFWSILRCILTAVYWFHPLIWLAAVISKQDCELACDEAALKLLGEEERIAYGKTLVTLIGRKMKASDIVCTATTMTAGAEGIKERIRRIVDKPRRLAAVLLLVIMVAGIMIVCTFTQAKAYPEGVYVLEGEGAKTITTECFQVTFPDSLAQKIYFGGTNGTDIIIYHRDSDREIGRFCMMSYEEAVEAADESEVVVIGEFGASPLLHTYIAREEERAAQNEYELYLQEEEEGLTGVPGTDSNEDETTYIINEEQQDYLPNEDIPAEDMVNAQSSAFTGYEVESEAEINITYHEYYQEEAEVEILEMEKAEDGNEIEETSRVYLPNEIITETYIPMEESPCYLYVPADNTDAGLGLREEIAQLNEELVSLTDSVRILYLSRESMQEALRILVANRTPYVGDAVRVSKIAGALPTASGLSYRYVELETATQPYAVTLYYKLEVSNLAQIDPYTQFLEVVLLFASVENLEKCTFQISELEDGENGSIYEGQSHPSAVLTYERSDMEDLFGPLYPCSETEEKITELYNRVLAWFE